MFFLVISNPQPSKPNEVKAQRLEFRTWIESPKLKNKVVSYFPRVGRGSIVIFDVKSNDELHSFLTDWTNVVPAQFDIYPLATPDLAEKLLR